MTPLTPKFHEMTLPLWSFYKCNSLVNENRSEVTAKLGIWWDVLEFKGFCLCRTNTEYMEGKFSISRNRDEGMGKLDG